MLKLQIFLFYRLMANICFIQVFVGSLIELVVKLSLKNMNTFFISPKFQNNLSSISINIQLNVQNRNCSMTFDLIVYAQNFYLNHNTQFWSSITPYQIDEEWLWFLSDICLPFPPVLGDNSDEFMTSFSCITYPIFYNHLAKGSFM